MKQKLQLSALLILLSCTSIQAQKRVNKNLYNDDVLQQTNVAQKQQTSFYTSALSGYYFEGFEIVFPPTGWQIVDVQDPNATWISSNLADFPSAYEGAQSAYCQYENSGGVGGEDWLISPKFTVTAGDSLSFQFKFQYLGYPPDSTFFLVSTTDSALTSFTTSVADCNLNRTNYTSGITVDELLWKHGAIATYV